MPRTAADSTPLRTPQQVLYAYQRIERARRRFQLGGIALLVLLGSALWLLLKTMRDTAQVNGRLVDAEPTLWFAWLGYFFLVLVFYLVAFDRDDLAHPPSSMPGPAVADDADAPRRNPSPVGTGSADRDRPARVAHHGRILEG